MRELDYTEEEFDHVHGNASNYVMSAHTIYPNGTGPDCEGAGHMPQTIVTQ